MSNAEKLYEIVRQIPTGKVLTYGRLAEMTGIKSARVVGNILHENPDPESVPCHRVVNRKGELALRYAFGGASAQAQKLASEGIVLDNSNRVDLNKYLCR